MKTASTSRSTFAVVTTSRGLAIGLALVLACSASFAEKPEGTGKGGKKKGESQGQMQGGIKVDIRVGGYFGEQQRIAANTYYGQQFSAGRCPPGLAKKNNGCLPPGQTKKYSVGQPLAVGVIYHSVPASVVIQLGVPPIGHKYVRVAADILLIAIGTGMVVDAIQDLGRL